MKTYIFLISAIIFPFFLTAQLQDDFSDGDFTNAPAWHGTTDNFTVNNGELQLLDADPGSSNISFLYTNALTSLAETTTWEFLFRMDFAPSSSNFGKIYLTATNVDLAADQNAYYLKLGGISGTEDALELYRQDGASSSLLISGTTGSLGNAPAMARVKITRADNGTWQLFADYSGGTDYVLQGTASDATYDLGNYIGYYCKYTSSRAEDFYLDDVSVSPLFQDTEPPILENIQIHSATEITAKFNEPLAAALNNTDFSINNGIGTPVEVALDQNDPTGVVITLGTPLTNLSEYILTTNHIADTYNNIAGLQSLSFTFYNIQIPLENELIISELLPDPTPVVGLPEAEFIELFNPSQKVINLANITLKVNTSSRALPNHLLLPQEYISICSDQFAADYQAFGEALGIASFPALTNSGGHIQLINEEGNSIFEIDYDDSWYHDDEKDNGGWSLEMIDLTGPYNCGGNWLAAKDFDGGTPGHENSSNGEIIDIAGPRITAAIPLSKYELLVTFNEAFDQATATDLNNFSVSNGLVIEGVFLQADNNQLLISFANEMQPKTVYLLNVATTFTDCLGNESAVGSKISFGLPEEILQNEILINEILFNPETSGYDFVEFHNVSDKIVNLKNLQLFNFQKETGTNMVQIEQDYLFFPGEYTVITTAPSYINERYAAPFPNKIIENRLPSFDNDQGNITIKSQGITIDSFDYNENLHFPLINPEGVSLEKIDETLPSYITGNWHSASSLVGFATPTYKNSQYRDPNNSPQSTILKILDKTFSPDNDGATDVLRIGYQTDKAGYFINLAIFDAKGRLIKKSNNNYLLGTQGIFKWDGTNDNNEKVRMGIYIIWAEIFAPDGAVSYFKESCVVAGFLK